MHKTFKKLLLTTIFSFACTANLVNSMEQFDCDRHIASMHPADSHYIKRLNGYNSTNKEIIEGLEMALGHENLFSIRFCLEKASQVKSLLEEKNYLAMQLTPLRTTYSS